MALSLFRKRDRDASLSGEELEQRVDELTRQNRDDKLAERERSILALRHRAALESIATAGESPEYPQARTVGRAGGFPRSIRRT